MLRDSFPSSIFLWSSRNKQENSHVDKTSHASMLLTTRSAGITISKKASIYERQLLRVLLFISSNEWMPKRERNCPATFASWEKCSPIASSTSRSPCMGGYTLLKTRTPSAALILYNLTSPQYNSIRLSYARPRSLSNNKLIITGQTHTKFKLHFDLSRRWAQTTARNRNHWETKHRKCRWNHTYTYAIQFCQVIQL